MLFNNRLFRQTYPIDIYNNRIFLCVRVPTRVCIQFNIKKNVRDSPVGNWRTMGIQCWCSAPPACPRRAAALRRAGCAGAARPPTTTMRAAPGPPAPTWIALASPASSPHHQPSNHKTKNPSKGLTPHRDISNTSPMDPHPRRRARPTCMTASRNPRWI